MRVAAFGMALFVALQGAGMAGCADRTDRRMMVARGLYDDYCADCHGSSETGLTPVEGLGFDVPDLTRMAKRHGGTLPREELTAYIDGRHQLEADARGAMPSWGERLYPHLPERAEVDEMREGTIGLILDYLASVQVD